MDGATRGRFGVTRDADGSLSSIYSWPWYWRYPAALAGIVACFWFAAVKGATPKVDWSLLILSACGAFTCLSLAYEACLLAIFLAIVLVPVWGISKLAELFFPGLSGWQLSWQAGVFCMASIYFYSAVKSLRDRVDRLEKSNAYLLERVASIQHPPESW